MTWLEMQVSAGRVLAFSHIANENKSARGRMKAHSLGTRAGVPDYVIVVPCSHRFMNTVLWVELKRVAGSKRSKEQERWVEVLAPHAKFCYGHQEAVEFVSSHF